jgi:hypothetical protein
MVLNVPRLLGHDQHMWANRRYIDLAMKNMNGNKTEMSRLERPGFWMKLPARALRLHPSQRE